ncbi:aspartate/glutamate racemase family protein [Neptunicella sp. SCSIO 80796]|uniref:aspartate/glutamate racemase family protein n=1 Tax=Neptunicella plasticusilytica TaxID=3117012 RepID=UPI003A4D60AE
MKTIGLIGGMSWESSLNYYRLINQGVKARLGGLHSAKMIMHSLDFAEIEILQRQDNWSAAADILVAAAKGLQAAGADCVMIGANTMHIVAPEIEQAVEIPLIHIADATAHALQQQNIDKVGLLGTAYTMQKSFFKERLKQQGIDTLVPDLHEQDMVHQIIYQELCQGVINPSSKQAYLNYIDKLTSQGAQAIILGCTEIGLLIDNSDTSAALFDTTLIHTDAAIDFALT